MITPHKGRTLDPMKPVYVHRNISRGRDEEYSVIQSGMVIGHTDDITVRDAQFRVREAGRQRTITTGIKQVHAFVRGWVTDPEPFPPSRFVRYNPHENATFVLRESGDTITAASKVHCSLAGVAVSGMVA